MKESKWASFMVQPHESNLVSLSEFYDSPNVQSSAVHFIGYLRKFDKTQDDKFLHLANEIAFRITADCPYTEVSMDGKITSSPSEIMIVICLHLSELGIIPT